MAADNHTIIVGNLGAQVLGLGPWVTPATSGRGHPLPAHPPELSLVERQSRTVQPPINRVLSPA
jgi:hypothetical protein